MFIFYIFLCLFMSFYDLADTWQSGRAQGCAKWGRIRLAGGHHRGPLMLRFRASPLQVLDILQNNFFFLFFFLPSPGEHPRLLPRAPAAGGRAGGAEGAGAPALPPRGQQDAGALQDRGGERQFGVPRPQIRPGGGTPCCSRA